MSVSLSVYLVPCYIIDTISDPTGDNQPEPEPEREDQARSQVTKLGHDGAGAAAVSEVLL